MNCVVYLKVGIFGLKCSIQLAIILRMDIVSNV